MADEAWTEHYYGQQPPHPTCLETTTMAGITSYVCGPDCPKPAGPDPERDKRIDAYRDRERRRAARALDRYFEVIIGDKVGGCGDAAVAGERFVEQVGDYVLARLGDDVWTSAHHAGLHADMWVEKCAMCLPGDDPRPLQQKSVYGVPAGVQGGAWVNDETGVPGRYTEPEQRNANPYAGKSIEELGEIMSSGDYRNPPPA